MYWIAFESHSFKEKNELHSEMNNAARYALLMCSDEMMMGK